ncbi:GSCFA domain-containing protein [Radicibacter daui]|uniref:GSCFA domain-containing protein n=1 Tax=Radicibacter daui TaxID=3064829 RepID=UPI004046C60B
MLSGLSFVRAENISKSRKYNSWGKIVNSRHLPYEKKSNFDIETEVFAIGSCFANEIRSVLERRDILVHPKVDERISSLLPSEIKINPSWGGWDERVHYQCYTPFSVLQDLEGAVGLWRPVPESIIETCKNGDRRFWDPYRRALYGRSVEDVLSVREIMFDNIKYGVETSKIIVITLGLVEAFCLNKYGGYISEYNGAYADRVTFANKGFLEVLEALRGICRIFENHFREKRLVFTVSPIPLSRTFLDVDVVTATMRGKSILRAAVDVIREEFDNVDYWPSYEFVMWSGEGFRVDDVRHVRAETVEKITEAFCDSYFSSVFSVKKNKSIIDVEDNSKFSRMAGSGKRYFDFISNILKGIKK